ncbi:MAG: alpha-L-glutamate ligase-like protein [Caldithrix sp.]|nr:alpha-L-glutamate ligase-like protein [Caldithrix sp.]
MDWIAHDRVRPVQTVCEGIMLEYLKKFNRLHGKVLGINQRNLDYIYPNNPREHFKLADDKSETKKILEEHDIPTPPTYALIQSMGELQEQWQAAAKQKAVAIKPAMGRGGGGILILEKNNDGLWQKPSGKPVPEEHIQRHIANILFGVYSFGSNDKAIIEYMVVNHPLLARISSGGVPDLRVITYKNKNIMSMLRVPTKKSDGRANLHQGALGIAVDLESGTIGEGTLKGTIYREHPDSCTQFYGETVPFWNDIMSITTHVSEVFPFKYMGTDIVLDRDLGPLVMEINLRPGLEIQNVNRQGLLEILKEEDR